MRTGMIQKVVAVLLALILTIGLVSQLPGIIAGSFADGESGVELTDQLSMEAEVMISTDGSHFDPLIDGMEVSPEHYFRFAYVLTKNAGDENAGPEKGIRVGDWYSLPISSVYQRLDPSELLSLEEALTAGANGSFVATFDDRSHPTQLILTFSKEYAPQEETMFGIVADIRVYMQNQVVTEPFILTVPIKGGTDAVFHLRPQISGGGGQSVLLSGVRNAPEILWTIDANVNLSADQDMMILRYDIPSGLKVESVTTNRLTLRYDASSQLSVEEGAAYAAVSGVPSGEQFFYEVLGDQLLVKIPNPEAGGYRKAFRVRVRTSEMAELLQPWLSTFTYVAGVGSYPDEAATEPEDAATATAEVSYSPGPLLTKRSNNPLVNSREIEWTVTINEGKLPLKDVVLHDLLTSPVAEDEIRPMTFALSDVVIESTGMDGVTRTIVPVTPLSAGTTSIDLTGDAAGFALAFADEDISNRTVVVRAKSRIADRALKLIENIESDPLLTTLTFRNAASLRVAGQPADVNIESDRIVHVKYGVYVHKQADFDTSYDDEKYVRWDYYFNMAGIDTGVEELVDRIDLTTQRLILVGDQIPGEQLFVEEWTHNGNAWSARRLQPVTDYTVEVVPNADPEQIDTFKVKFTNKITKPVRISFRTRILKSVYEDANYQNASDYRNTAIIGDLNRTFGRNYTIAGIFGKEVKSGVNYDDNHSVIYRLRANPVKSALPQFRIKDVLPNGVILYGKDAKVLAESGVVKNSIVFKDFALKALPLGMADEEANYVPLVSLADDAKYVAFVLDFNAPLNNGDHYVEFKAHMDPDTILFTDKYVNRSFYTWQGQDTVQIRDAEFYVNSNYQHNGSLSGMGTSPQSSTDPDAQFKDKRIRWQLDLNYRGHNIHNLEMEQFIEEGQELDVASIRFYTDTVDANGTLLYQGNAQVKAVDPASEGFRVVVADDQRSFKVFFYTEGETKLLAKPYRVTYETKMVGVTRANYGAVSKGKFLDGNKQEHPMNLTASVVKYTNFKNYISKSGSSTSTSNITDWTLKLNEARSDIYELTITDTFSPGLEPIADSFKLYDQDRKLVAEGDEFFEKWFEYIPATGSPTEARAFRLVFRKDLQAGHKISNIMYIDYKMTLVEEFLTSNNLYNRVSLDGQLGTQAERDKEIVIVQKYYNISVNESGINRQLRIVKKDKEGQPIANTVFRVERIANDGLKQVGMFTTDASGTVVISNLRKSSYRVTEWRAADGFIVVPKHQDIEITDANNVKGGGKAAELTFVNDNARQIRVTKLNKLNNQPIGDVEFKLLSEDRNTVLRTGKTDADGVLLFDSIGAGTYWLAETPKDGFYPAEAVKVVILDTDTEQVGNRVVKKVLYPVTIQNEPYRILRIFKTDTAGNPLKGTEFTVTDPQGRITHRVTTDLNGKIEFVIKSSDLFGEYRFVETKATEGYVMDATPFSIDVQLQKNGVDHFVYEYRVQNRPVYSGGDTTTPTEPEQPQPTQPTTAPTTESPTAPTSNLTDEEVPQGGVPTNTNANTTEKIVEKTTGEIVFGANDIVEVSKKPEHGTVVIQDGQWEYIPTGVPTKDNFEITIVKPDGSKEIVIVDVEPEDVPQGGLPITGQLPEWVFFAGGALIVLLGVVIRIFANKK